MIKCHATDTLQTGMRTYCKMTVDDGDTGNEPFTAVFCDCNISLCLFLLSPHVFLNTSFPTAF